MQKENIFISKDQKDHIRHSLTKLRRSYAESRASCGDILKKLDILMGKYKELGRYFDE